MGTVSLSFIVLKMTDTSASSDIDAVETSEWLDAIDQVVEHDGLDRARHLLTRVVERAQHIGSGPIATLNTPYVNTIPASLDEPIPGDPALERRLRSIIRWNAMAMVVRANKESSELGGHIAVPTNRSRPSTRSDSTTSGTPRRRVTAATLSTSGPLLPWQLRPCLS